MPAKQSAGRNSGRSEGAIPVPKASSLMAPPLANQRIRCQWCPPAFRAMIKEKLCLENGAKEFWVVDSDRRPVRVSTADDFTLTYSSGQEIPLPLFGMAKLAVDEIFPLARRVCVRHSPAALSASWPAICNIAVPFRRHLVATIVSGQLLCLSSITAANGFKMALPHAPQSTHSKIISCQKWLRSVKTLTRPCSPLRPGNLASFLEFDSLRRLSPLHKIWLRSANSPLAAPTPLRFYYNVRLPQDVT